MGEVHIITEGFFFYGLHGSLTQKRVIRDSKSFLLDSWEIMAILHASMTNFFFFKHVTKCAFYLAKI